MILLPSGVGIILLALVWRRAEAGIQSSPRTRMDTHHDAKARLGIPVMLYLLGPLNIVLGVLDLLGVFG